MSRSFLSHPYPQPIWAHEESNNFLLKNLYHSSIENGKTVVLCKFPKCDYKSDKNSNFKRHFETMHQVLNPPIFCCDLSFITKGEFRHHTKSVHKEGHRCAVCGKLFNRKALLERHMSIHTGKKPYKCCVCDYASANKANVRRHLSIHGTGDVDKDKLTICHQSNFSLFADDSSHSISTHSNSSSPSSGSENSFSLSSVTASKPPAKPLISHSIDSILGKKSTALPTSDTSSRKSSSDQLFSSSDWSQLSATPWANVITSPPAATLSPIVTPMIEHQEHSKSLFPFPQANCLAEQGNNELLINNKHQTFSCLKTSSPDSRDWRLVPDFTRTSAMGQGGSATVAVASTTTTTPPASNCMKGQLAYCPSPEEDAQKTRKRVSPPLELMNENPPPPVSSYCAQAQTESAQLLGQKIMNERNGAGDDEAKPKNSTSVVATSSNTSIGLHPYCNQGNSIDLCSVNIEYVPKKLRLSKRFGSGSFRCRE